MWLDVERVVAVAGIWLVRIDLTRPLQYVVKLSKSYFVKPISASRVSLSNWKSSGFFSIAFRMVSTVCLGCGSGTGDAADMLATMKERRCGNTREQLVNVADGLDTVSGGGVI